jgi:hypothetical protein
METQIVPGRIAGHQHEPQTVRSVGLDNINGVDTITQGLAHFPAQGVHHQSMDKDIPEGNFVHKGQAGIKSY